MKTTPWKPVVTYALLAFVAVSVLYAVVQELRRLPSATASEAPVPAVAPGGTSMAELANTKRSPAVFYATYYHGNVRCPTCRKIEAYSKEAIETRFASEIKAGSVVFRMLNYDEQGNEHYKKDYGLEAQSLIVSEVKAGKELRWANLPQVWDLTYDKEKFIQYVASEFKAFIKQPPQKTTAAELRNAGSAAAGGAAPPATAAAAQPAEHHIVAYYLHGNTRCPSCVKIEQYADAAVREQFAGELASGKLEWLVINYDEPENRHYWDDFQLEVKTVVLADYVAGQRVRYKRLDQVWELLGDQQAFSAYIAQEVKLYLEGV